MWVCAGWQYGKFSESCVYVWPQGAAGWESDDEEDMEATMMDQNMDLWQTRRDEAAAEAEAAAAAGAAAEPGAAEAGAGPLSADAADSGVADTSDERKHKLEAQAARANDGLDMFAVQGYQSHLRT